MSPFGNLVIHAIRWCPLPHSALLPYGVPGVGLWLNTTYYFISNNYQDCCVDNTVAGLTPPTQVWRLCVGKHQVDSVVP
jgi:hypothetical protein